MELKIDVHWESFYERPFVGLVWLMVVLVGMYLSGSNIYSLGYAS